MPCHGQCPTNPGAAWDYNYRPNLGLLAVCDKSVHGRGESLVAAYPWPPTASSMGLVPRRRHTLGQQTCVGGQRSELGTSRVVYQSPNREKDPINGFFVRSAAMRSIRALLNDSGRRSDQSSDRRRRSSDPLSRVDPIGRPPLWKTGSVSPAQCSALALTHTHTHAHARTHSLIHTHARAAQQAWAAGTDPGRVQAQPANTRGALLPIVSPRPENRELLSAPFLSRD